MKKFFFSIVTIFIILSCGNDPKFVELNLVFDQSLNKGKYPDYFKNIVLPFSSNDCSTDYFFKPINVGRLDISNKLVETNAWHFEDRVEITVESATNWLTQYFTDSIVVKHLTLSENSIAEDKIKYFINKKKTKYDILILSEDSDADEYNGVPILHNAKDVNKRIQDISCKLKSDKIYVLVNPQVLKDKKPDSNNKITQLLEEADILFNNKDYQGAELKYNEVLNLDKNNSIALERINSIKKINQLIKEADILFTQKNYKKARSKYQEINKKYPNIQHVVDRINEINKLLQPPKPREAIVVGTTKFIKKGGVYYSSYAKYEGGKEHGKAHGQGTMIFIVGHFIPVPKYSSYRIKAERGDKLSGRFNKGYFVTGFLYDKNGKEKKAILAGK